MLNTPAPFPLVGSFALYDHEGVRQLARILGRAGDSALISLPERPDAGGNLTVPLAALIDGTPLQPEEQAELRTLERTLHPFLRGDRRARSKTHRDALVRLAALGERRAHAAALARKVARLQQRQRAQRTLPQAEYA